MLSPHVDFEVPTFVVGLDWPFCNGSFIGRILCFLIVDVLHNWFLDLSFFTFIDYLLGLLEELSLPTPSDLVDLRDLINCPPATFQEMSHRTRMPDRLVSLVINLRNLWSLFNHLSFTFLDWNIFLSYGLITLTQGNKLLKPMVLNNWTSKSIAGIALWRAVWCPPDPHHIGSALNQSVEHRVLYSYIIDKIITFRLSLLQWTIYLGCLK